MIPLWIIGSGGHAKVAIATARATDAFDVVGCLDDDPARHGTHLLGVPVAGALTAHTITTHRIEHAFIAIGSNAARCRIDEAFGNMLAQATLVHPRAWVADGVTPGEGTLVCAGAIVQPDARIGRHVILNTASSVDHDSVIADYVHIGPGCNLSGTTTIGEGAFLGVGSRVIPGTSVGEWTIVGAGSTVIHDLPPNVTAVGTPAKVIRQRPERWHR